MVRKSSDAAHVTVRKYLYRLTKYDLLQRMDKKALS